MKIDIHTHAFPKSYVTTLDRKLTTSAPLQSHWIWDSDVFLGDMDRWGVDVKVLSLSAPGVHIDDPRLSSELARISNDEYAEICARWPNRFKMFAAVPISDQEASCKELERVKSFAGQMGIALGSNICGRMLDDPAFGSFFELANDLDTVIFIHPMGFELPEPWKAYRLQHLIGWPIDTTFAVSRLVLGGFFDRYPKLRVIAAHVGGAIPYLSERLERGFKDGEAQRKPSYYFRNHVFYDTAGPTHQAIIESVVKMYGIERVVFGTDYPFGTGQEGMQYMEKAIWNVQNAGLSEADAEKIFSGNIEALFNKSMSQTRRAS